MSDLKVKQLILRDLSAIQVSDIIDIIGYRYQQALHLGSPIMNYMNGNPVQEQIKENFKKQLGTVGVSVSNSANKVELTSISRVDVYLTDKENQYEMHFIIRLQDDTLFGMEIYQFDSTLLNNIEECLNPAEMD